MLLLTYYVHMLTQNTCLVSWCEFDQNKFSGVDTDIHWAFLITAFWVQFRRNPKPNNDGWGEGNVLYYMRK